MKGDDIAERLVALAVRGAESRQDFVHKLGIALKELHETRYWLRVVTGANLVSGAAVHAVLPEVDALCRILGTSKRTASATRATSQPRNADPIC